MTRSIDIKSALVGGFVVAIVLFLFGAVPFVTPEEHGRFQIETNNGHAFILDTATGQVWSELFPDIQSVIVAPDPNFFVPKTHHSRVIIP